MARNKFGGNCYRCGQYCAKGEGFFEKIHGTNRWRVQHATCAAYYRNTDQNFFEGRIGRG